MKTRSPLRNLLFAPLMALALITGALTPIPAAHADPGDQDTDVIVEATPSIDADARATDDGESLDDTTATDDEAETDADTDVDVDATAPAVEDVPDATADSEPAPNSITGSTTTHADDASRGAAVEELAATFDEEAAADTAAAAPLSVEANARASVDGLKSMRLRKANGAWVTITPQMQANALVVMNTIKGAKWSGVSARDKERLTVIALMVMAQESTFYTHPYAHTPDRNQDVGPFQQRSKVGWYADGRTQAENIRILNNIPYATRTFIEGHRVPRYVRGGAGPKGYIIPGVFQMDGRKYSTNWRTDSMWEVAAGVQRPARQYRYHYEYWRPVVQSMVTALKGQSSGGTGQADVYTTPGDHTVDGRKWRTTCESYSKTIKRCRATIWATTVSRVNGKFVQKNGWQFNNLTYLPSRRASWKGNPLAVTGTFTSGGRQWRTSCADSWTGPKGCRSFMQAYVIEAYTDGNGNRQFRDAKKEVFNNVVRFSN